MVALNSPPPNFPDTSATNLFLIGSNYARVFQDAEKTNGRNELGCNEAPLCCIVLFVIVIWEHMWMFVIVHPRDALILFHNDYHALQTMGFLMLQCKHVSRHSPSWFVNVYWSQPVLLVPFPQSWWLSGERSSCTSIHHAVRRRLTPRSRLGDIRQTLYRQLVAWWAGTATAAFKKNTLTDLIAPFKSRAWADLRGVTAVVWGSRVEGGWR